VPSRHRRSAYDLIKLATFDEFHAEIAGTIALAHIVDGDDVWMIKTGGSLRFAVKTLQMHSACPLTRADDFQSNCAIETLLSRQINYALTAAPNFLQQFVVAEISGQLCNTLVPRGMLAFRYNERLLILNRKHAEAGLKKASRAASFGRVGGNFLPALWTNSKY
jgi:hypothetical protein